LTIYPLTFSALRTYIYTVLECACWKQSMIYVRVYLCFVCYIEKCLLKNVLGIFRCLVEAKIMINENHFQFDRKSSFNFWKTIYGFEFFIHKRMFVGIRHCRSLKFVDSLTLLPKILEFRYLIAGIRQVKFRPNWPEYGNYARIRWKLPDSSYWSDFDHFCLNPVMVTRRYRIPFYIVGGFFV
jgi:hypothetical protein